MNLNGLSTAEVAKRTREGKSNRAPRHNTDTIGRIVLRNTLTVFNLVNLILALMIISVGAYKNLLFILVAIANTLISIINSIRAKRTIDKMRLISEQKPTVIREGKHLQISQSDIVEGDLLVYSLGDQIIVDCEITQGEVEVNESFITGEQDNIAKSTGDKLISGSFIVSGTCYATATAVGAASQLAKIEATAHTIKADNSKLFTIINNIVKYISYALIPIGALLLWSRFRVGDTSTEVAVTSTVAGLISMIPEGLVLLTSSVLALATIRLSKKQVLVQDLYSVETLARVDTICLDKTGTLTTGKMTVSQIIPASGSKLGDPIKNLKVPHTPAEKSLLTALKLILSTDTANNATSTALKQKLLKTGKFEPTEQILEVIPFSSDRKYSGVITDKATYLLGAPEFLTGNAPSFDGNYRVLSVVKYKKQEGVAGHVFFKDNCRLGRSETYIPDATEEAARRADFPGLPAYDVSGGLAGPKKDMPDRTPSCFLLGYVLLEDELRKDAHKIIDYFYDNDIDVKIISGDNLETVQSIAAATGVHNTDKAIDLSTVKTPNYSKLVQDCTIFARVKPNEKKNLIKALKSQNRTVAMTGDGVNDILAMKEADVSMAIGEGSDAARRSSKLVLLNSDFSAIPSIIDEGRQSINNLERSATLFLSKNTYAAILAVIFILVPIEYPYAPIEMSLLNALCIGIPGLILALEKNTARIKDQFVRNIKRYSVPTGILVALSMLVLSTIAEHINLPRPYLLTFSAIITFVINMTLIYRISRPLNPFRATLITILVIAFILALTIPASQALFDFAPLF